MEKKAVIKKVDFTNEYKKGNDIIYYHKITLDSGEEVSIGVNSKYPSKIAEGTNITYTQNGTTIKLVNQNQNNSNSPSNQPSTGGNRGGAARSTYVKQAKGPEEFLGYCFGYAKDMVIAGKKVKDSEEVIKIARALYNEVKVLLAQEQGK